MKSRWLRSGALVIKTGEVSPVMINGCNVIAVGLSPWPHDKLKKDNSTNANTTKLPILFINPSLKLFETDNPILTVGGSKHKKIIDGT